MVALGQQRASEGDAAWRTRVVRRDRDGLGALGAGREVGRGEAGEREGDVLQAYRRAGAVRRATDTLYRGA